MVLISINKVRIGLIIFIVVIGICLVYFLVPQYSYEYIYFNNKKNVVTRIEVESVFSGGTYFTPGYYEDRKVPTCFVQPKYAGITSGFELIMTYKNDTYVFIAWDEHFDIKKEDCDFIFKIIDDEEEYESYRNDNSGRYVSQIEKSFFKFP